MPEPLDRSLDSGASEHSQSLADVDQKPTLNYGVDLSQQSPPLVDASEESQSLGRVLVPNSSSPAPSSVSCAQNCSVDSSDALVNSDIDTARIIDLADLPLNSDHSAMPSNHPGETGAAAEDPVPETPNAHLGPVSAGHVSHSPEEANDAQLIEASLVNVSVTPSTLRVVSTSPSGCKRRRSFAGWCRWFTVGINSNPIYA